jgi:hypothetical protein
MRPSDQRPAKAILVHLITPDERGRFDETLERSHWLGAGLVGGVMRYVAVEGSE